MSTNLENHLQTIDTLKKENEALKEKCAQIEMEKNNILLTAQKIEVERNAIMASMNELISHLIFRKDK